MLPISLNEAEAPLCPPKTFARAAKMWIGQPPRQPPTIQTPITAPGMRPAYKHVVTRFEPLPRSKQAMGGSDEFEAASRAYWRERHRAVQHLSDSQYLLAHMVRLPLYLWETAVPATGAVIVADMLHSYAKGFRAA